MIEKTFKGPIHYQLKNALDWIQNAVLEEKIQKVPNQAEAIRTWNYPIAALEELLANAVYHRSYQVQEPITIRITATEIEITSHPGFDASIREKDIAKYQIRSRKYRNRRIGDFLKELKLIEGRNTGFPRVMKALEMNGSAPIRFEYDEQREFLSVILPIHPSFRPEEPLLTKEEIYQNRILAILEQNPATLTELSLAMNYKGITSKLRRHVDRLIQSGRIGYISGPRGEAKLTRLK